MQEVEKVAEINYPKCNFENQDGQIQDLNEQERNAFIDGVKWQQNNISLFLTELKERIDSFEHTVNQNSYIKELIDEWTQKQ